MCVTAVIVGLDTGPIKVSNLGQIAEAVGIPLDQVPLCEGVDINPAPEYCLCILDTERLGQMLGLEVEPPTWDPEDRFGDCVTLRAAEPRPGITLG